jgi:CheY-like chemotaxis protein/signal transduction histidine kinase
LQAAVGAPWPTCSVLPAETVCDQMVTLCTIVTCMLLLENDVQQIEPVGTTSPFSTWCPTRCVEFCTFRVALRTIFLAMFLVLLVFFPLFGALVGPDFPGPLFQALSAVILFGWFVAVVVATRLSFACTRWSDYAMCCSCDGEYSELTSGGRKGLCNLLANWYPLHSVRSFRAMLLVSPLVTPFLVDLIWWSRPPVPLDHCPEYLRNPAAALPDGSWPLGVQVAGFPLVHFALREVLSLHWIATTHLFALALWVLYVEQQALAVQSKRSAKDAATKLRGVLRFVSHETRSPLSSAFLSNAILTTQLRAEGASSHRGAAEALKMCSNLKSSLDATKRLLDALLLLDQVTNPERSVSEASTWMPLGKLAGEPFRTGAESMCRNVRTTCDFVVSSTSRHTPPHRPRRISEKCAAGHSQVVPESPTAEAEPQGDSAASEVTIGNWEVLLDPQRVQLVLQSLVGKALSLRRSSQRLSVRVSLTMGDRGLMPACDLARATRRATSPPPALLVAEGPTPGGNPHDTTPTHGGPQPSLRDASITLGMRSRTVEMEVDAPRNGGPLIGVMMFEVLAEGEGLGSDELGRSASWFQPFESMKTGHASTLEQANTFSLSIVKAIAVDQLGGDVGVASHESEGWLMAARFPVWVRPGPEGGYDPMESIHPVSPRWSADVVKPGDSDGTKSSLTDASSLTAGAEPESSPAPLNTIYEEPGSDAQPSESSLRVDTSPDHRTEAPVFHEWRTSHSTSRTAEELHVAMVSHSPRNVTAPSRDEALRMVRGKGFDLTEEMGDELRPPPMGTLSDPHHQRQQTSEMAAVGVSESSVSPMGERVGTSSLGMAGGTSISPRSSKHHRRGETTPTKAERAERRERRKHERRLSSGGFSSCRGLAFIVDDEYNIRYLLSKLFRSWGFEVEQFNDGQEVVERLSAMAESEGDETWPALMVLDITMPRMNGFEVLERLALMRTTTASALAREGLTGMKVINVTGNVLEDDQRRMFGLGSSGIITKPPDADALSQLVDSLVGPAAPTEASSGVGSVGGGQPFAVLSPVTRREGRLSDLQLQAAEELA